MIHLSIHEASWSHQKRRMSEGGSLVLPQQPSLADRRKARAASSSSSHGKGKAKTNFTKAEEEGEKEEEEEEDEDRGGGEVQQKEAGGGLLVLQWGHMKRPRRARNGEHHRGGALRCVKKEKEERVAFPRRVAAIQRHSQSLNPRSPPLGTTSTRRADPPAMASRSRHSDSNTASPPERCGAERKLPDAILSNGGRNGSEPSRERSLPPIAEKVDLEFFEWPRILVSLSCKEKEEDFLIMKGTKLPQRPKKRPKLVEKALHNCSPGFWLSDLTRGRYDVREKKCMKKRPRGLKAMESADSDSD